MNPRPEKQDSFLNVLLVEANSKDARILQKTLGCPDPALYNMTHVKKLSDALSQLNEETYDLVLLDLSLPDSWGLNTVVRVHEHAPEVPIIVLTENDDETPAIKAVQEGTQDYLVKGQLNTHLLERSMRYAIERHRMLAQLRAMSLSDDLTGLYNRRGFLTLAEQQIKMSDRTKTEKLLLFADLDNLKQINDTQGHHVGDRALIEAANILRKTFRESDIIARIGGDEFTVFLTTGADIDVLPSRLQKNLDTFNKKGKHKYFLSISTGWACYDPGNPSSLDDLMARADELMYKEKREKKKIRES